MRQKGKNSVLGKGIDQTGDILNINHPHKDQERGIGQIPETEEHVDKKIYNTAERIERLGYGA